MTRALFVAAIVLMALAASSPASAQVLQASATSATQPMQIISISGVVAGRTYQFRVNPSTATGDSILALMNPSATTNGAAVAGSDGDSCGLGGGIGPACFEWLAPAGVPSTGQLRLWAYRPIYQGTATVESRWRVGSGAWSAWSNIATNIAYGGNAIAVTAPSSGRVHYTTRHRPGRNATHFMWLANTNEWQIIANTYRAPDGIGRSTFDVADVVAAGVNGSRRVIAGAFPSANNTGRMEVLQNDWFLTGEDWDGDGLGRNLENALKTCDRTTSPNPSPGFTCSSRWDCAGFPTSEECRGALRDTDHDGLSDYLEVYEYNDLLMRVSQWGADPAHLDIFMELDSWDQDGSSTNGVCTTYSDGVAVPATGVNGSNSANFFQLVASAWANGPTTVNPDGTPGARVHYDVGTAYPQPNPEDDRWGNFGAGGTCVTCTNTGAVRNGSQCAGAFPQIRRSVFHYSHDVPNGGAAGQGSGAAFFARDASHHVHELGHHLVGGHSGPFGSTAQLDNDFGNWRSTYISRMNYTFQDLGGTTGGIATQWNLASFSSRRFGYLNNNMLGLVEACPVGAGGDLSVLTASTINPLSTPPESLNVTGTAPSQCWNVDWNQSGLPADTTATPRIHARYGSLGNRLIRRSEWTDGVAGYNFFTPRRGLADMTTTGNVLIYAWTQRDSGGIYRVRWRGESTGDCNTIPLARTSSLELIHPEFYTGGSYPGCYRPGVQAQFGVPAIVADAVAVERASVELTSGNFSPGVIFVHNNAGTLRFSSFGVAPDNSTREFSFTPVVLNVDMRPLGITFTDASTTYSRREPALVQIPSTLETLLVYVDTTGNLRQSSIQLGNSQFWEVSSQSLVAGSSIASTRSVSLVTIGQEVWMASPSATSVRLYRLTGTNTPPAASRSWQLMATLPYTTQHRPNLAAVADLLDPSQTRLVLLYTSFGDYKFAQSSAGTTYAAWTTGWSASNFEGFADPGLRQPSAGAAVWDDRPIVTTAPSSGHPNWPDLRSTLEFGVVCTMNSQCTGLDASATCNTTTGFCELSGDPYVRTDFAPFTRGPAIGNYADYDDWRIIPWRTCEYLRTEPGLPGAPTRYCGPIPRWDEPFGAASSTTPPLNDAIANSHLYSSQPACQSPQPCGGL